MLTQTQVFEPLKNIFSEERRYFSLGQMLPLELCPVCLYGAGPIEHARTERMERRVADRSGLITLEQARQKARAQQNDAETAAFNGELSALLAGRLGGSVAGRARMEPRLNWDNQRTRQLAAEVLEDLGETAEDPGGKAYRTCASDWDRAPLNWTRR